MKYSSACSFQVVKYLLKCWAIQIKKVKSILQLPYEIIPAEAVIHDILLIISFKACGFCGISCHAFV